MPGKHKELPGFVELPPFERSREGYLDKIEDLTPRPKGPVSQIHQGRACSQNHAKSQEMRDK